MAKKITVKHFLETKVKPILIYGDILAFPIYCRVTYNRRTTNFRSFTGVLMSEKAYRYYIDTNKILDDETHQSLTFSLKDEILFITQSINRMVFKDQDLNVFDSEFIYELKKYLEIIEFRILEIAWAFYGGIDLSSTKSEFKKTLSVHDILNLKPTDEERRLKEIYPIYDLDSNPKVLYSIFNRNQTLIKNIRILKNILGIDIYRFFFEGTIIVWEIIESIISLYKNRPTIYFIENYDIDLIYDESIRLGFSNNKKTISDFCSLLETDLFRLD